MPITASRAMPCARAGSSSDALRACRLQQLQQRGMPHFHAAAGGQIRRPRHQHRQRLPAVGRVARHGQHRLHGAGFEQPLGDARGDAGPLRASARRTQAGTPHGPIRAEEPLVAARRIAHAPVDLRLQRRVVGPDELAGAAAAMRIGGARDAAVGAQVALRCGRGRIDPPQRHAVHQSVLRRRTAL